MVSVATAGVRIPVPSHGAEVGGGPSPAPARRRWPRSRALVAGGAGLAALGFFIASALNSGSVYYLTIGELRAKGDTIQNQRVRVAGHVTPGTIERAGSLLRFTALDRATSQQLPVVYRGVIPDAFNEEAEVVVEGKLTQGGTFEATTLLAKCPSKFEGTT
ncbi:MAG TPA: cytochrome c maturation protein CcmE [Chloroflexota bacterium]|nr:cytochrome c maturation protein CcmE [Chloroflexota bacterium]